MRAGLWCLALVASAACSSKAGESKVSLADPRLDFESHRRGQFSFGLADADGTPVARDVAIRIDIKHPDATCSLFGQAAAADFTGAPLRAKISVEGRSRGGGGCGYGEIDGASMTVSVATSETADPFAVLALPPQHISVPDHRRPPPLPELDAELAQLASGLAELESVTVPECTRTHVVTVDTTRPLEGVELDTFRAIAAPTGTPTSWSRMRSSLFSRLSRYRKLGETAPAKLLAELRSHSHLLVYVVTADVAPSIISDGTFAAGRFAATAYLVLRAARTPVCSFQISASNSSVVGVRGPDALSRIKTELQFRLVEDLHGKLAALSKKLQPPDAPGQGGEDPARFDDVPAKPSK